MKKTILLFLTLLLLSFGVYAQNAPSFTSTPVTIATQDVAYSYDANATDIDVGDVLTFSILLNPGWLSINSATGLLTGTPTNANVGPNSVTIRVTDNLTLFADQTFVINVANVNDAPSFTSTAVTAATQGVAYSYDANATDPDVPEVLTFSIQLNPGWLSINPGTGLLTGTPTNANVGPNNVTIRVSDDEGLFADQSFVINVANVNDAPSFTSTAVTIATQGVAYSYDANATDPDVPEVLTFSIQLNPGWLSINPGTGLLTGTPTNANVGPNNVTIRVSDDEGLFADQSFVINVANVNDAPSFTSTAVTIATQGIAYSYDANATDPDVPEVLTFSIQLNPGWLSIIPGTGLLTGTPTSANVGPNNVIIRVSDDEGLFADQSFVINVANVNDAPSFTSTPVTAATQGVAYSYDANATDPDVPEVLTFSIQLNPGWLSIIPGTGLLTGTPTNANVGPNNVTIRVSDDEGLFADQSFVINVANVNDAPTFTSMPDTVATEDVLYSSSVAATDGDGDGITYSATQLPPSGWLVFDPDTRILSGTPTNAEVGFHDVTLRIYDGTVNVDSSFQIRVANVNDAPTFASMPDTVAIEDVLYSSAILGADVDVGDSLIYRATVIPAWLTFNDTTGVLSGTPTNAEVGFNDVTLTIFDGTVTVDSAFQIRVANANDAPTFAVMPDTVATEDLLYSSAITGADVDEDDSLIYRATVLPLWLTFNDTTGVLSGTPTNDEVGFHDVTLTIFDGTVTVDSSFQIRVANVNDAPTFDVMPDTVATEDVLYSSAILGADVDVGDSLIYRATALPAWLTFNDTTGVLSGTPANAEVGFHAVTLTIFDGTVTEDSSFQIRVANANDAPTFAAMPDTVATEDVLYSSAITGADVDVGDSLIYRATVIPAWLTFNDTTRILSGTPANAEVGFHAVTLTIFDGTVTVDSAFQIRVANVNDAPTFAVMPDTVATEDLLYSSAITGADVDVGDSLIYRATVIPAWLTFNDTTGILSGTPANAEVGFHAVTLTIFDGTVTVDSAFQVRVANVNDAPTFSVMPDTIALEDALYRDTVSCADIDVGDSLIYSAPVLPAWLTFNDTTRILSGTAGDTLLGDHNVTLRVFDGTVNVDSSFVITVLNTNDPPTFTSIPDTVTLQGALYSYTPTATDIDGDILYFTAPVLPIWLSFDTITHVLSGIPNNDHVGNNNVSLRISDTTVNVVQSFVIVVENINDPPVFTSTPITEARPGVAYNYTVTALDVDGDNLVYTARVLPGWLTFDPSTQLLSATPSDTDVGDQHVTIRVTDGSLYVDQTFVISVSYANHAPNFISDPATSVVVGETYIYTIVAYDLDSDPLTYSAPVLPGWLTFYPETRVISGVPRRSDIGKHDVTLRVSDGTVSADQSFPITVEEVNTAPYFTSTPVISVTQGELYVYYVTTGDAEDDQLTFSSILLPDWLNFDVRTGVLNGTPNSGDIGDHNVTLSVSDGDLTTNQNFTITVEVESGVGISDLSSPDFIVVYPNPTNGRFVVELAGELEKELSLEIIDPAGRILIQQEFPPYQLIREEYDLGGRPAGMYFIRLLHDSDQIVRKLILH